MISAAWLTLTILSLSTSVSASYGVPAQSNIGNTENVPFSQPEKNMVKATPREYVLDENAAENYWNNRVAAGFPSDNMLKEDSVDSYAAVLDSTVDAASTPYGAPNVNLSKQTAKTEQQELSPSDAKKEATNSHGIVQTKKTAKSYARPTTRSTTTTTADPTTTSTTTVYPSTSTVVLTPAANLEDSFGAIEETNSEAAPVVYGSVVEKKESKISKAEEQKATPLKYILNKDAAKHYWEKRLAEKERKAKKNNEYAAKPKVEMAESNSVYGPSLKKNNSKSVKTTLATTKATTTVAPSTSTVAPSTSTVVLVAEDAQNAYGAVDDSSVVEKNIEVEQQGLPRYVLNEDAAKHYWEERLADLQKKETNNEESYADATDSSAESYGSPSVLEDKQAEQQDDSEVASPYGSFKTASTPVSTTTTVPATTTTVVPSTFAAKQNYGGAVEEETQPQTATPMYVLNKDAAKQYWTERLATILQKEIKDNEHSSLHSEVVDAPSSASVSPAMQEVILSEMAQEKNIPEVSAEYGSLPTLASSPSETTTSTVVSTGEAANQATYGTGMSAAHSVPRVSVPVDSVIPRVSVPFRPVLYSRAMYRRPNRAHVFHGIRSDIRRQRLFDNYIRRQPRRFVRLFYKMPATQPIAPSTNSGY